MAIHRALLLAILACICLCRTVIATRELNNELSMVMKHEKWMAQYGRVYKDATEKTRRFKVFKASVEFIESSMPRLTSSGSASTNSLISPMMSSGQPTQTRGSKKTP
uniref:Cathepsin propeptide inhibitor domain-containing protein n=1 Tax=Triticum urartu TaxID=4572 RepID=A0A8R7UVI1_TRIUA